MLRCFQQWFHPIKSTFFPYLLKFSTFFPYPPAALIGVFRKKILLYILHFFHTPFLYFVFHNIPVSKSCKISSIGGRNVEFQPRNVGFSCYFLLFFHISAWFYQEWSYFYFCWGIWINFWPVLEYSRFKMHRIYRDEGWSTIFPYFTTYLPYLSTVFSVSFYHYFQ